MGPEYADARSTMKPTTKVTIQCAVCGAERVRPRAWLKKLKRPPTCSRYCSGVLNGKAWATHGHKGRAAWTPEHAAAFPAKIRGANNGRWQGGRRLRADGYIEVLLPGHPRAKSTGYVLEHLLVMETILGRPLAPKEVVHHKDRQRANNAPENLQLFASNAEHRHIAHGARAADS
jgi:hypothetical protein